MTWIKLAWAHRTRIIEVASKLRWSRRALGLTVVAVGVYLAATHGYLDRWNPGTFTNAQWAQLIVNLTGFGILYVALRSWWGRQDEVWDEVDLLRTQVDELRVAMYEHEHEATEEAEDERPDAQVYDVVDLISTEELPSVPEPATTVLLAVRQAPISGREPATVQREVGGRAFTFRQ